MGNIVRMTLSDSQREVYEEKAYRLDAACQMLVCTDHAKSKATALYDDIENPQRQYAIDYIDNILHPH